MKKFVLVTGSAGEIGQAICKKLSINGYDVIGLDRDKRGPEGCSYIEVDLKELVENSSAQEKVMNKLSEIIKGGQLYGLVNNAAIQILGDTEELSIQDFKETLNVNLLAPFSLSKICIPHLKKVRGSIVNVGSIHSKLTKRKFIAYASSKAALEMMTRSMAIDMGGVVRVNMVCPAAIDTDMLRAGFGNDVMKLQKLIECHPAGKVGCASEVAEVVKFLMNEKIEFMTGSVMNLCGGISGLLNDPE